MKIKVSVIVLNYKNYSDTIHCLDSLLKSTYPRTEIIVVDNDSQNDSLKMIAEELSNNRCEFIWRDFEQLTQEPESDKKILLLQSPDNKGYAAGNNLGIRIALARHSEYILILNSDTVVNPDFLEPLVAFAEKYADIAVVGPKVINLKGDIDRGCARRRTTCLEYFFRLGIIGQVFKNNWAVRRHHYIGEYNFDQPKEVDLVSGCCMLIKSHVFQRIGLLDEKTFLNLEEFILHEKLRRLGLRTFIVPSSVIMHKHGGSIAKAPSAFVKEARRASFRYYLSQYRYYHPWLIFLIMLNIPCHRKCSFRRRKSNEHNSWSKS